MGSWEKLVMMIPRKGHEPTFYRLPVLSYSICFSRPPLNFQRNRELLPLGNGDETSLRLGTLAFEDLIAKI